VRLSPVSTTSPGIFDVLTLLGKDEALARLKDATALGVHGLKNRE
jgi:hypothetical protein